MSNIAKKLKEQKLQKLAYIKQGIEDLLENFSEEEIKTMLQQIVKDKISPKIQNEKGREFLASLIAYALYSHIELTEKTKEQIYFVMENYENQRRLNEAIRESNQLLQNKTNFLHLLYSMFIKENTEIPTQVIVNVNRLMPELERIEDYIEHIPEGEL